MKKAFAKALEDIKKGKGLGGVRPGTLCYRIGKALTTEPADMETIKQRATAADPDHPMPATSKFFNYLGSLCDLGIATRPRPGMFALSADFAEVLAKSGRQKNRQAEDMQDEYDFRNGVRGKYARRYAEGTNLVALAPDVSAAFPDSQTVNEALRALLKIARRSRSRGTGK